MPFNMIVGLSPDDGELPKGRTFNYTSNELREKYTTLGELQDFPTIILPEVKDQDSLQEAQVGSVSNVRTFGTNVKFTFTRDPSIKPIPTSLIASNATAFGCEYISDGFELNNTHWAVKEGNLHKILAEVLSATPVTTENPAPPFTEGAHAGASAGEAPQANSQKQIFIVHGHDTTRIADIRTFIERATDRRAVVLSEEPNRGLTIFNKLQASLSEAEFAILLFTSDDEGRLAGTEHFNSRARQNVVFEYGYCLATLGPDRTALLYEDGVELPSDLGGMGYVKLDDGGWVMGLRRELSQAGIDVDLNMLP